MRVALSHARYINGRLSSSTVMHHIGRLSSSRPPTSSNLTGWIKNRWETVAESGGYKVNVSKEHTQYVLNASKELGVELSIEEAHAAVSAINFNKDDTNAAAFEAWRRKKTAEDQRKSHARALRRSFVESSQSFSRTNSASLGLLSALDFFGTGRHVN